MSEVAEGPASGEVGFVGGKSGGALLGGFLFEMEAEFVVEVVVAVHGLVSRAEDASDGGGELVPAGLLLGELAASEGGEAIELGALTFVGKGPLGIDAALGFEAMEGGVEGAGFDLEDVLGGLLDVGGDGVTVGGSEAEGTQDEEVERTLEEVKTGRHDFVDSLPKIK